MKRFILSIFTILITSFSWAQEDLVYILQPFTEQTEIVYTDMEIPFYKRSGEKKMAGKIPAAQSLRVENVMNSDDEDLNKYMAVNYQEKTVYVEKKNVAFKKIRTKENDFYFRIGAFYLGGEYNNSLLYLTSIPHNANYQTDSFAFPLVTDEGLIDIKVFNNKGLKDITNLIQIDYQGEYCGAESGDSWLYWSAMDGFNQLADLIGWADMDYIAERFIFPTDEGGKSGKIIYEIEHGVLEEDTVEADYKITKKQKIYTLKNGKLNPEFTSLITTLNR